MGAQGLDNVETVEDAMLARYDFDVGYILAKYSLLQSASHSREYAFTPQYIRGRT